MIALVLAFWFCMSHQVHLCNTAKIHLEWADLTLIAACFRHTALTPIISAHVREGRVTITPVLGQRASSFGDALREIYQASVVRADFILVCAVP